MQRELTQLEQLLRDRKQDWVVNLESGALCVTNEDGLEAYIAVSGSQIIAETPLFTSESVLDAGSLNSEILKTHHILPLTTICIKPVDGHDYYMAFGALSSGSSDDSIIFEIDTLFANVEGFLDLYEDYVK